MSHYPTDSTSNDKGVECPGCGYVYEDSGDGEIQPQSGGIEDNIQDFKCPECGLVFDFEIVYSPTWSAEHPKKCDVKGYHVVVYKNKSVDDTKSCLYCGIILVCDCEVWDYEKNKIYRASDQIYIPYGDRPGHCKHKLEVVE